MYSKSVKAGKRIYYLDVKKSRNNDLFLAITESKKKFSGEDDGAISHEKHKIFLYKEDFDKFTEALTEILEFINRNNEANGARDIREFHSYRSERQEADYADDDAQPAASDEKYNFDVDFEI